MLGCASCCGSCASASSMGSFWSEIWGGIAPIEQSEVAAVRPTRDWQEESFDRGVVAELESAAIPYATGFERFEDVSHSSLLGMGLAVPGVSPETKKKVLIGAVAVVTAGLLFYMLSRK